MPLNSPALSLNMKLILGLLLLIAPTFIWSQDTLDYKEIEIKLPGALNSKRMHLYKDKPFTGIMVYPYGLTHYAQIIPLLKGKIHGEYKQFHKNGMPKESTNYEYGKRDGVCIRWFDNGQMQAKSFYEQGHLLDTVQQWYKNGQLKSWSISKPRKSYISEMHMYYESGQKWVEITSASQKRWHENGQLAFKGAIVNNKSEGKLKYFNEKGKLIKVETYHNGKLIEEKQKRDEPTK